MKKAAWVVPEFLEGSGGHRTIFQNVQYLCDKGYICDVYVEDKGQVKNTEELNLIVEKYFGHCDCNFYLGYDLKGNYDIIFATAWFTAKVVRDFQTFAKKAYFIQDFEALFNPMGDGYLMAANSYCYGLAPVTIGKWLSHKMQTEYHSTSQYFDFCADLSIYHKDSSIKKENAICFVYQPDKPRRCSQIGIEALGIVKYLRPDVKIYLYGSKVKGNVWFEHENLGIISIEECSKLYNRCKVGLCISSSNPSRVPFEMMATGLPVVDLHMDNNVYDMPEEGVVLSHYTPESIAQTIIQLLNDEQKQNSMSNAGIQYMKDKSIEHGLEQFYRATENIVNEKSIENSLIEKVYRKPPIIADVFLQEVASEPQLLQCKENCKEDLISRLKKNKYIRHSKIIKKLYQLVRGY